MLHITNKHSKATAFVALLGTITFVLFGAFGSPIRAEAAGHTTVTCETPQVVSFTPHIYGGALHSFDVVLSGSERHLPLVVEVAGESLDLRYANIMDNNPANTVIHVDVPIQNLPNDVSIDIRTLQITNGPPPVCASAYTFHVTLPGAPPATANETSTTAPVALEDTPAAATSATEEPAAGTPAHQKGNGGRDCAFVAPIFYAVLAALLLGFVALVLYAFFVAGVESLLLAFAAVPALVLLFGWYSFDRCHDALWFPIAVVLAAAGWIVYILIQPEVGERVLRRLRS